MPEVALQAGEFLRKGLPAAALNRNVIGSPHALVRVPLQTSIMLFPNWSSLGN